MRTFCEQGGKMVLQMRTSALFVAKNTGFFEIYGVPARARGELSPSGQGGGGTGDGVNLVAILCARPLWIAPNF